MIVVFLFILTIFNVSAVGSVKQNLSGKECDKAVSFYMRSKRIPDFESDTEINR